MTPKQRYEGGRHLYALALQRYVQGVISKDMLFRQQNEAQEQMIDARNQMIDGVL